MSAHAKPTLRGITWSHTRGFLPLVATAQRYEELHPEVRIEWHKRSLRDFEAAPLAELAKAFDLIVLDHPFIGEAHVSGVLLPLDQHLPQAFLEDQRRNSVGGSHASYEWQGSQLALAIDAAAPVAAWRPDLLETLGVARPESWSDLMRLARAGHVEIPAVPINCLMNFYGLCIAAGATPFTTRERVIEREPGLRAFAWLSELVRACDPGCLRRNPIQSLETVASASEHRRCYCAFPYGYSNYSREGYAPTRLTFGELPGMESAAHPIITTLGGTGLAISRHAQARSAALDYARFVAAPETQRTLYTQAGGQPGHRQAWEDPDNNRATLDYFRRTLPVLERAFVRPRHAGYLHGFQDPAANILHEAIQGKLSPQDALEGLDACWRKSLTHD